MTILIIAHNQKTELKKCVESIRQYCDIEDVAVIVIDNNSDDGTKEWLESQDDLAYAVTEEVESVPHIINQTLELFQLKDDLFLLPPQGSITQGCLWNMKQALYQQDNIGGVEPLVKSRDCQTAHQALFLKWKVVEEVGLFDESVESWEDTLAAYENKLSRKSFRLALVMNAVVHYNGEQGIGEIFQEQEENKWDYVLYIPELTVDKGVSEMISPVKEYSGQLKENGKINILFPVMRMGEKPYYSYEEIFCEISAQGYILQDAKAVQFPYAGELVTGYDLILSNKKKQLLVMNSENPLISYNMNQIVEAYQQLGWQVIKSNPNADLYQLLQQGIDRLFVINNVGWIANMGDSTRNVWEQLGIPSINFILDHPMYYDDTLCQAPGNGTLLCVDENHVQYVKRFYSNINNCYFMPLAGDNKLAGIERGWNDREIEVLYVGGYKGSLERSLLPDGGEQILESVLQNRDCTVEEVVERELRDKGEFVNETQLLQEIQKYRKVDWHVMTYIRVEVVRALVRGGVNVTVYGGGWEAFEEFDNPHFIYKGRTSQEECLEHMKNSKIVLNVMPWFKRGTHDRVINAMLAGAVALTDGSSYMDEVFEQGKDYVVYDINHLEQLPEIIKNILSCDNAEMRKRAYEKAIQQHRWIQRIEQLETRGNETRSHCREAMQEGKTKRLLIFNSKNPLYNYNIREIAEAYRALGWQVVQGNGKNADEISALLEEGIDRLFVVNNVDWIVPVTVGNMEVNLWDQLGIPSINYILDHPLYYDSVLRQAPKLGTLLCVDENHVEYVKRFYPNINKCHFLPLAGDNELDGFAKKWEEREIDLLYVGSYKGSMNLSKLEEGGVEILGKILQNRDCTTEEVIEKQLRELDKSVSDEQIAQEVSRHKRVDLHVMTYIRVEVIKTLIQAGIDVTVYGAGWEMFDEFHNPHFIYKGATTQEECLEHMKNSKIVLNVMPWFKKGTHDRVINAMLAGAVALTDGSSYMDEVFEQGRDYVAYDIKYPGQLPEIVRTILSCDNAEMRKRAYEKATKKHRWIQRIEELEKRLDY